MVRKRPPTSTVRWSRLRVRVVTAQPCRRATNTSADNVGPELLGADVGSVVVTEGSEVAACADGRIEVVGDAFNEDEPVHAGRRPTPTTIAATSLFVYEL